MPKRTDINKVLIIGSGPIIIGQACEFDYSGTQACKALRKLGYEIVLVNSNPATIMTDPETADETYIEPLNAERLEEIIAKERPDALLPNLGGQSGLNLCEELYKKGILDKYNVKVIGVQVDSIERGEDRIEFKKTMDELGIEMARSEVAYSVEDGLKIADKLGYPVVLRPAYTMGGAGGGLVYNKEELKTVMARGLQASLVGQVLVEESILGWEELELEVVRDAEGNMITVCFIENIDPLGVHTGDSFCSAPMLTISEECQQRLQEQAYKIVDSVQVIGGTNVQFAHDPVTDRIIVIEINPRTSRSSALASKATGFPIALVSAMLAAGLTLKDIPCGKYGTLDKYVPDGDYVVIKFARWAFEKFKGVEDKLGTQMRAVGEVMSIGKTYKEAFQKAIRSLETGRYGLGHANNFDTLTKEELLKKLVTPSSERHFIMYEALRKGATVDEIFELTKVKTYFIEQMKELVEEEEKLLACKGNMPSDEMLTSAKKDGFSDKYLSQLLEIPEEDIRNKRISIGVEEAWEGVHVSGTPDSAYYYSTYNAEDKNPVSTDKQKIMILGGGPNRIGQGIEFDYCCVHAALALKKLGFETIIVNCNPETVSTDYDTSDKLYFEPLTLEDVLSIHDKEKPVGVIAQFGGQTPLNLASQLKENGVNILGTTPETMGLIQALQTMQAGLDKVDASVNGGSFTTLNQNNKPIKITIDKKDSLVGGVTAYLAGTNQVNEGLKTITANNSTLINGASQLANGTAEIQKQTPTLISGVKALDSGASQLYMGTSQLVSNNRTLVGGSAQLSGGAGQISSGAGQLADGSSTLGSGLNEVKNGVTTLNTSLKDGAEQSKISTNDDTFEMMASPVDTSHKEISVVENNGHAMAPYMMSVALYVCGLAFTLMYPIRYGIKEAKSSVKYWASKATVMYTVSTLAAVVMISCLRFINGFEPQQLLMTYLFAIIVSAAFMSIIVLLNLTTGFIGEFLLLVFMIINLGGSAGTYPLETSASFFKSIHYFVPYTYSVDGFRKVISMANASLTTEIWVFVGIFVVCSILTICYYQFKHKEDKHIIPQAFEKVNEE